MTPAAVLLGRLLSGVGAFLFALALGGIVSRMLPRRRGRARPRLVLAVVPFVVLVAATLRGPSGEPGAASPRGALRLGAGVTSLGPFVHATVTAPSRVAQAADGTGGIVAGVLSDRLGPASPWALVALLVAISSGSLVRRGLALLRARRVVELARAEATSTFRIGQSPTVEIVVTPAVVGSPFVAGPGASRIIVPAAAWRALSPDEREAVLLHEVAHLRGRHPWLAVGVSAVAGLFAFVPLVSRAERALRAAIEDCADEAAVSHGASPLALASALVRVAERGDHGEGLGAPYLGVASAGLEVRVAALLDPAAPPSGRHVAARWALVLGVALVALRSVVFP